MRLDPAFEEALSDSETQMLHAISDDRMLRPALKAVAEFLGLPHALGQNRLSVVEACKRAVVVAYYEHLVRHSGLNLALARREVRSLVASVSPGFIGDDLEKWRTWMKKHLKSGRKTPARSIFAEMLFLLSISDASRRPGLLKTHFHALEEISYFKSM